MKAEVDVPLTDCKGVENPEDEAGDRAVEETGVE
jgi:hypothetical protein